MEFIVPFLLKYATIIFVSAGPVAKTGHHLIPYAVGYEARIGNDGQ